ncbi:hypothetical protein P22_1414 [Propionispora sp. 2/2-37]|uniref:DUF5320 domain-containing protein n=1 Tax=Propionispora sp. 2/2-37 TaxID=1677858 RepID=UPI0006BB91E2|nr:DUF5320 domain-containing protein [Propionispora sp. 2/2-37]CUH95344.1 hypothetical protein P22_1414 [Propionispora sp. 2/2-37]
MPRGDGTGPMGNGPLGRGRGGCQRMGFGNRFGTGFGRGRQGGFGFAGNTSAMPEPLEEQAERLEAQAANLRNLARQNRKAE